MGTTIMPSIFTLDGPAFLYEEAGLTVNRDNAVKSDFVDVWSERTLQEIKSYMQTHGIDTKKLIPLDKSIANNLYAESGFTTLKTVLLNSISDVTEFDSDSDYVMIKPAIGAGTKDASNSPASQLAYCVISKATLLSVLEQDQEFFTGTPHILQEAINPENSVYDFAVVAASINGSGDIHFLPGIQGERYFKNKVVQGSLTCSLENHTPEMLECKQNFATFVAKNNIKNCICNLQLLKNSAGVYVPIDLQYRITYSIRLNLINQTIKQYAVDLIKFAYDLSVNKPTLNVCPGVKLSRESVKSPILVTGVVGSNKQETLSLL